MTNETINESAQTPLNSTENEVPSPKKKSYFIAYLLFFTLGWLGAHRFYVGKWTTGFIYLAILAYFQEGVLLAMLVDIFLLFFIVRKARRQAIEDPLSILFRVLFSGVVGEGGQSTLAPWAQKKVNPFIGFLGLFDNLARIFLFFIGPVLVLLFSFYISGSLEMTILMVFILVLAGYIGPMEQVLTSMQRAFQNSVSLSRMPFFVDVLDTVRDFYEYYYQNKPRTIIYYLLYPLVMPLLFFLPQSMRQEFSLYRNILLIILLTIFFDALLSFSSSNSTYVEMTDILMVIFIVTLFSIIFLVFALMPTITTCFKMRFSGKRKSLALFTTIALALMGAMYAELQNAEIMPISANLTLENKMKRENFKADLTTASEMFLSYYRQHLPSPVSETVDFYTELTNSYRKQILGMVTEDEALAFKVVSFTDKHAPQPSGWLGIYYSNASFSSVTEPVLLFLINEDGAFHHSWQTLPETVPANFEIVNSKNISSVDYVPTKISWPGLIDEHVARWNEK